MVEVLSLLLEHSTDVIGILVAATVFVIVSAFVVAVVLMAAKVMREGK